MRTVRQSGGHHAGRLRHNLIEIEGRGCLLFECTRLISMQCCRAFDQPSCNRRRDHAQKRPARRKAVIDASCQQLRLRISAAESLLMSSHTSHLQIGEIAWRVGFTDQSHFARIFREAHGCSPSDFRRNLVQQV
ncbi:helix-turn-helix domain-containing protein [Novosphingobium percolationis]|uniref:helix-turn-helix domain-containing protein n=1 Tax=Novosphingobium percolationis TaxID=2871811 RepID=UPI0038514A05